jgi:LPPG:FO 2-phospho-L-lactate transferase
MKIVAFAGGVGGAKLADGLARNLLPENLTIVVNTGDDFEHWGLKICPDLDTVCYTLAGLANPETGWGRTAESWEVLENVRRIGGLEWFHIGDKDLATHLERTRRLKANQPLSQIVRDFCRAWGIAPTVLPMTDQFVATLVNTVEMGELAFQEYFVHQHCEPVVKGFHFAGIDQAKPAPGVLEAILQSDAVIFCPSNPWVSIDPILKLDGIRSALAKKKVVAVSPIIAGQTVKGPAAKMFAEMGISPSSFAVANHYKGFISDFVLDVKDAEWANEIQAIGIRPLVVNTLMKSGTDRLQLAQDVLNFIQEE